MTLDNGLYVRKHNPFMSSTRVRSSPTQCKNILNSDQLAIDLTNKQLPQFGFYTPNINNDGHETNLTFTGNYLQNWLNTYLSNPAFTNGTLLIVTFDEDEGKGNVSSHVPAFMWGPDYLYSGVSVPGTFNHYSLTKLLEENWGLGNLGRGDVSASSLMNMWRMPKNSASKNSDILCNSIIVSSFSISFSFFY